MIIRGRETYLTATEAAKHLSIARATFYRRYKQNLCDYKIGRLRRTHYSLAQIEELSTVESIPTQMKGGSAVEQGRSPNFS
jgi:hypothetical protein